MLKGHPGIRQHIFWTIGFSWSEIGRGSTGSRCSSALASGPERYAAMTVMATRSTASLINGVGVASCLPSRRQAGKVGLTVSFSASAWSRPSPSPALAGEPRRVESRRGSDWLRLGWGRRRDLRRFSGLAAVQTRGLRDRPGWLFECEPFLLGAALRRSTPGGVALPRRRCRLHQGRLVRVPRGPPNWTKSRTFTIAFPLTL